MHKSQGLTFDRAVIDVSGSFTHGQTYVALSRCRTLEGLVLSAPLTRQSLIYDKAVDSFTRYARQTVPDENRLRSLQKAYFLQQLSDLFGFESVRRSMERYVRLADETFDELYPSQVGAYRDARSKFADEITEVARKFSHQYTRLVDSAADYAIDETLQSRINSGAAYFKEKVEALLETFGDALTDSDNKETRKKLREYSSDLLERLRVKAALLEFVGTEGFSAAGYLRQKAAVTFDGGKSAAKARPEEAKAGKRGKVQVPADILHPELYRRLISFRNEEAASLGVPVYLVIHQKAVLGIANLLPADRHALAAIPWLGRKTVEKYGDRLLEIVGEYLRQYGDGSAEEPSDPVKRPTTEKI